jgi:hypothetical protein
MKLIYPITIWKNGEQLKANLLNAYITRDNLKSFSEFYYTLNEGGEGTEKNPLVIGKTIAEGKIIMDGENYLAWDGSNDYAFTYIAEKLNLTLIL